MRPTRRIPFNRELIPELTSEVDKLPSTPEGDLAHTVVAGLVRFLEAHREQTGCCAACRRPHP